MRNGHRNYLHLSASAHPGDEHPPQSWKMIGWQASSANRQLLTVVGQFDAVAVAAIPQGGLAKWRRKAASTSN
jgi:hypothetical protein